MGSSALSPDSINPVISGLKRRGSDGFSTIHVGFAELGHASLVTTPEAIDEKLPLRHTQSDCLITADARLDNRAGLIEKLELESIGRAIGDGELILLSYLRWREDCVEHLRGDFAFAIWDQRRRRLFCARDHVGMRQLHYAHKPDHLFAFATDADALARHPQIGNHLNECRILDYLEDYEAVDLAATFYSDVFRLPPSHCLTVDAGRMSIRRYWSPPVSQPLKFDSPAECVEAFASLFFKAVRDRLRSSRPIGATLSGGIDSGSVAAIASHLLHRAGEPPLKTFSGIGLASEDCVETKMIFAASRHLSVDATYISYDELPSLLQLIDSVRNQPDPFDGDMTLFRAVYRAAQRSGVNVVLDGGSGDTALAHEDPLPSLVRRARLAAALDEARRQRQNLKYGPAPLQRVTWEAARLASPDWLKKLNRKRIERSARASSLASSDLAKRLGWHERWQQNLQHTSLEESNFSRPWAYRLHPYVVVGRERYDRVASEFGIEARDPFTDIELLSFLAAVPGPLLDNTGRSKWLLREAVKGFLPTEFIWRKGKEHIGWNFTETLWRQTDVSPCTNLHPLLGEYVEAKALGHFRGGDGPNSSRDLRIQHLNNWLNRN